MDNISSLWISGNGNWVSEYDIFNFINNSENIQIHVGSDSKIKNDKVLFAMAICILSPGKGGKYFIKKINKSKKLYKNLLVRLQQEVIYSIDIAERLRAATISEYITVHLDLNLQTKFKSSKFQKQLSNYVLSMGYRCLLKPHSWASCTVADKYTK